MKIRKVEEHKLSREVYLPSRKDINQIGVEDLWIYFQFGDDLSFWQTRSSSSKKLR